MRTFLLEYTVTQYTLLCLPAPRQSVVSGLRLRAGSGQDVEDGGVFKLTENCRNDIDNSPGRDGGREINKDSLAFTEI